MKQILFVLVTIFTGTVGNAQTIYQGRVTDQNLVPLIGVDIVSVSDKSIGTITDMEGYFSIALDNPKVTVSHVGFRTKVLSLSDKTNPIMLQEQNTGLIEVVVTGNRENQKRSEVPAAINVIGTQDLAETKAFGIDQIVNQVPGVFMMTSRTASNEQHMMSVRSPISTKALFLYLEDGLPIRPTSVFNHNALLEMNDLSYGRIEVLKGPASSIYGSESIGGSFNFITKKPTKYFSGNLGIQGNDLGLLRYDLELSDSPNNNLGFYLGTQYVQRSNGPIEHSDYEKMALTFKTVLDISNGLKWTNVLDLVDYRSDMTGSLSEEDYSSENFESDQTFTEREALAFRLRSTLETRWNFRNKTSFNLVFRNNRMDQIPSYRIAQFREQGTLTGFGSGEINSNRYRSYMALIQHKTDFGLMDSKMVFGATIDYSPQDYVAEVTSVTVDTETGRNIDFTVQHENYILNYEAGILNYAGFAQYEFMPMGKMKMTAAIRYDHFQYDYRNLAIGVGPDDSKDTYDNFAPKLGLNYNFGTRSGIYANYSQGFSPPQVSTLYRNRNVLMDIRPSIYNNYEIGGYLSLSERIKLDVSLYLLNGKNTLISIRDVDDTIINTNAGRTRSYGLEYGLRFNPTQKWSLSHNGSYARHRYLNFFDGGTDYSDTDRETAPKLLGTTRLTHRPSDKMSITLEHELVGRYATSFEGQVDHGDGTLGTATYKGHSIFNLRATYHFKHVELWGHVLNIFDELYAASASYSSFTGQNSYSIGNPLALHGGIRYFF